MNPVALFKDWYAEESETSGTLIPAACCLSTLGLDGYPNARFVALKDVLEDQFVVTGPLHSRKGLEISACDKVALTFWWPKTERQVRVQGNAIPIPADLAAKYFSQREREAQIVSLASRQGQQMPDGNALDEAYRDTEQAYRSTGIPMPDDWGGYLIAPLRVEFMAFKSTRFHERVLYSVVNGNWIKQELQP